MEGEYSGNRVYKPDMLAEKDPSDNLTQDAWTPAAVVGMLLITCLCAFIWSHFKLFWVDELLEFYSDTRSTFGAVVQGQLRYPFSLEPPAFHLLLHGLHRLFPSHPELASRLPSIVSVLVTQVCVFRITRKLLHSPRAALLGMTFPFLFATFDFAAEARVYALLTALFALALAAYQEVLESRNERRTVPLIVLFVTCAAGVLVHYYGIFLPVPFLVGESAKAVEKRKIDFPVVGTLLAAFAVFALNLPFMPGLSEIRAHYYNGTEAEAGWQMIPITYMWLVGQYNIYENNQYGHILRFMMFIVVYVALPATAIILIVRQRLGRLGTTPAFLASLFTGLLLPVLMIVVAHYRTHAYVMRYSVPAVVSLAVLIACLLRPYLSSRMVFAASVLLSVGLASLQAGRDIQHDRAIRTQSLAAELETADLQHARASTADQHVYVQDVAKYLTLYKYAAPPEKALLVGFESIDRELFWLHRDPAAIFLRNMHCSTLLPVTSLEDLQKLPHSHLLVVFDDPKEEWIGMELSDKQRVIQVEPMGRAFHGRLLRVTFASPPSGADAPAWKCRSGQLQ